MKPGQWITLLLSIEFVGIACVYAYQRDWPRTGYFLCACLLNLCVLLMK